MDTQFFRSKNIRFYLLKQEMMQIAGIALLFLCAGILFRYLEQYSRSDSLILALFLTIGIVVLTYGYRWQEFSQVSMREPTKREETMLAEVAAKLDMHPPRLYVLENSTMIGVLPYPMRSTVLFGENLMEILLEEEIRAVLAHELAHIREHSALFDLLFILGAAAYIVNLLILFFVFFPDEIDFISWGSARNDKALMFAPIFFLTWFLGHWIKDSIRFAQEFSADAIAAASFEKCPQALSSALLKLKSLCDITEQEMIQMRIKALKDLFFPK